MYSFRAFANGRERSSQFERHFSRDLSFKHFGFAQSVGLALIIDRRRNAENFAGRATYRSQNEPQRAFPFVGSGIVACEIGNASIAPHHAVKSMLDASHRLRRDS